MPDLQAFVDQHNGQYVDFDGYYGAQCVDLAQFWAQACGLPRLWGDAKDIAGQASGAADWIANTPEGVPSPGDIIVWGTEVGPAGHVAICYGNANTNEFDSFDQNWPINSSAHIQHHNYFGVLGWLHPHVLDQQPPQPAPEPQPEPTPVTPPTPPEAEQPAPEPLPTPVVVDQPNQEDTPVAEVTAPVPYKPGNRTTEFWMNLVVQVIAALVVLTKGTSIESVVALLAGVANNITYTHGRALVKSRR